MSKKAGHVIATNNLFGLILSICLRDKLMQTFLKEIKIDPLKI